MFASVRVIVTRSVLVSGFTYTCQRVGYGSTLPWATRWFCELVNSVGSDLASTNVVRVIVGHRLQGGWSVLGYLAFLIASPSRCLRCREAICHADELEG